MRVVALDLGVAGEVIELPLLRPEVCLSQVNPIDHVLKEIVILERVQVVLVVHAREVLQDCAALEFRRHARERFSRFGEESLFDSSLRTYLEDVQGIFAASVVDQEGHLACREENASSQTFGLRERGREQGALFGLISTNQGWNCSSF